MITERSISSPRYIGDKFVVDDTASDCKLFLVVYADRAEEEVEATSENDMKDLAPSVEAEPLLARIPRSFSDSRTLGGI